MSDREFRYMLLFLGMSVMILGLANEGIGGGVVLVSGLALVVSGLIVRAR